MFRILWDGNFNLLFRPSWGSIEYFIFVHFHFVRKFSFGLVWNGLAWLIITYILLAWLLMTYILQAWLISTYILLAWLDILLEKLLIHL